MKQRALQHAEQTMHVVYVPLYQLLQHWLLQEVSRRVLLFSHSDIEGANISAAEGEICHLGWQDMGGSKGRADCYGLQ